MNEEAYDLLVEMIRAAYEACRSENMNCPRCSGRISTQEEEHDQFCQFQKHRHLFVGEKSEL